MTVLEGFRLSPQQQRLWLLQQAGHGRPFDARCTLSIEGDLDQAALKEALEHLVARHEILRTLFQHMPGMRFPLQVIAERIALVVEDYDLGDLSPGEQDARLETLQAALGRRPFDFERGPLFFDTEVSLLTPLGEQVATYGVGEIVICGPHVALGYWQNPQATQAAFAPDPFTERGRGGEESNGQRTTDN